MNLQGLDSNLRGTILEIPTLQYQHVRNFAVRFEWQCHLDGINLKIQGRGAGKCFPLALSLIQGALEENALGYLVLHISKYQSGLITGIKVKEKFKYPF